MAHTSHGGNLRRLTRGGVSALGSLHLLVIGICRLVVQDIYASDTLGYTAVHHGIGAIGIADMASGGKRQITVGDDGVVIFDEILAALDSVELTHWYLMEAHHVAAQIE